MRGHPARPREQPRHPLQTENRQRISTLTVFLWARVDCASRAAKNSPPGCFCAVFRDSAAAVRIRPPSLREGYYKTETPAPGSDTGVLGGRGWITQAAHLKKPRRGFFPRRTVRRVDAVRIHPPSLREGYYKTETPVPGSDTGVLGGRGWIRTTEAEKQQIYSLSPLATREHAHILFAVIADCLYILSSEVAFVNYFFHGFSHFLLFSIFLRFTAIKALSITAKDPKTFSVLRSFWSW